jgi:hypothetical protein
VGSAVPEIVAAAPGAMLTARAWESTARNIPRAARVINHFFIIFTLFYKKVEKRKTNQERSFAKE